MYKYTYPVTSKFQDFLIKEQQIDLQEDRYVFIGQEQFKQMIVSMHEYLGEAEHGGDIQELFKEFPIIYKRYYELINILSNRESGAELVEQSEQELQQLTNSMLEQLRATYQDLILFMGA